MTSYLKEDFIIYALKQKEKEKEKENQLIKVTIIIHKN